MREAPPSDVVTAAESAGLRYVADAAPGIRRRRQGTGFSYRTPDGALVSERTRARISALAVPPAWTDVWICPDPRGHLQATGRDARGRKQYRYHDDWRAVRDADKFARLADFGLALPDLRAKVDADLRRPGSGRDQVLALVVRLLDDTLIRVGNEEYAVENDSFGLTTLRDDHVEVDSRSFVLRFVGKSGVEHDVTVEDARLARLVRRCHELGGQELFTYRGSDGELASVSSGDVNDYLHEHVGPEATAKVFRTWGASSVVTQALAQQDPDPEHESDVDRGILEAIDQAAAVLRNTRAVCRQSYVHPAVPEAYGNGDLGEIWSHSRGGGHLTRADRALQRLLADQA